MVAARKACRAGRGAQRRRVPLRVRHASVSQLLHGWHVDPAAVWGPCGKSGVIVENKQNVRRTRGSAGWYVWIPIGNGIADVEFDGALERFYGHDFQLLVRWSLRSHEKARPRVPDWALSKLTMAGWPTQTASRDGIGRKADGSLRVGRLVLESWNAEKQLALGEKQVLLLLFWYMLFADGCAEAEFRKAAEHLSGDIGTARVVAQILGKLLLAAVWS